MIRFVIDNFKASFLCNKPANIISVWEVCIVVVYDLNGRSHADINLFVQ